MNKIRNRREREIRSLMINKLNKNRKLINKEINMIKSLVLCKNKIIVRLELVVKIIKNKVIKKYRKAEIVVILI
jgi:hypothetical protein